MGFKLSPDSVKPVCLLIYYLITNPSLIGVIHTISRRNLYLLVELQGDSGHNYVLPKKSLSFTKIVLIMKTEKSLFCFDRSHNGDFHTRVLFTTLSQKGRRSWCFESKYLSVFIVVLTPNFPCVNDIKCRLRPKKEVSTVMVSLRLT